MKAVILSQHGNLQDLEYVSDFPDPTIQDGHVIIRVKATSLSLIHI